MNDYHNDVPGQEYYNRLKVLYARSSTKRLRDSHKHTLKSNASSKDNNLSQRRRIYHKEFLHSTPFVAQAVLNLLSRSPPTFN